jgi:hypothetical protein
MIRTHRWWFDNGIRAALVIGLLTLWGNVSSAGIDQWTSTGPTQEGGIVKALAIDPQTPSILYAGMQDIGVFKSTDGGTHWSAASTGLPADATANVFAIDPLAPTTLYAGGCSGVFKSTNSGVSWSEFSSGLTNRCVTKLAINPQSPNILYAGTDGGGVFAIEQKSTLGAFVVSSILSVSRSMPVGTVATTFASIVNGGTVTGLNCGIAPVTTLPATFAYQTTDCATNQLIGSLNTPVNIPVGGVGCFIFALTPSSPIVPTDVVLNFSCTNTNPAPTFPGINTFLFSASTAPTPDVIASGLPCKSDDFPLSAVNLPGTTGANAVAFATTNVGAGGTIRVTADTGGVTLPLTLTLCQTNPLTGACINPTTPAASVTLTMGTGAQPTFSVFAKGKGTVPIDLVKHRIFLRFWDSNNIIRGATSVAVRTHSPACVP